MMKNKTLVAFAATLLLTFNNASFALENAKPINGQLNYPDYSYEFCGKDTCEKFNRKIFIFNSKVNKFIIRPVNIVWASVMPKYGMARVQSFYTNLEFPIRVTSCLLQKDFKSSKKEAIRFLTNTTLGVGGLFDPAKDRFKIEPCQEDMGQVLAHYKVKNGPYLVLPIVASGSIRDIAGQALDCPLNPTSYVIGPVALVAKSISLVNKTTNMQSLFKAIDNTYADPYEITKKLQAVDKYIKNSNLDRKEVLAQKTGSQNIIKISTEGTDSEGCLNADLKNSLKSDISLNNYNPQSPVIDSMRTALFDDPIMDASKWSELSVWNRGFSKQLKTSSINLDAKKQNYKYRYILQKGKTSPVAILYPSIGEGVTSYHSIVLAKMLYDKGYSVIIQGSAFQWEFAKSMPEDYRPGYPARDATYLRNVTAKIINSLESKNAYKFDKKILVGTSYGAMTTLFAAAQEEKENTLNISNYIAINPPIELLYALKQVDKYSQNWKNSPEDIKMRAAVTAEKVIQITQNVSDDREQKVAQWRAEKIAEKREVRRAQQQAQNKNAKLAQNPLEKFVAQKRGTETGGAKKIVQQQNEFLPFTEDEGELIISFIMKQKLSDLIFTIEHGSTSKKTDVYQKINNMSYDDYAQKYLHISEYPSPEQLSYDTSLYSTAEFLKNSNKYKIYHSLDDYFATPEQLIWLKRQSGDKVVFFDNGSHLGFLYRKEFIDEFKKDITLTGSIPPKKL